MQACDEILALDLLGTDASATSAALMPALASQLERARLASSMPASAGLAESHGAAVFSTTRPVDALCKAMSKLSDHADASTLAALAASGVPAQVTLLLRQAVQMHLAAHESSSEVSPLLEHSMWLLGSLARDASAAAAVLAGGGVESLLALLPTRPTTAQTTHAVRCQRP